MNIDFVVKFENKKELSEIIEYFNINDMNGYGLEAKNILSNKGYIFRESEKYLRWDYLDKLDEVISYTNNFPVYTFNEFFGIEEFDMKKEDFIIEYDGPKEWFKIQEILIKNNLKWHDTVHCDSDGSFHFDYDLFKGHIYCEDGIITYADIKNYSDYSEDYIGFKVFTFKMFIDKFYSKQKGETMLVEYVRNNKGVPVATIVAKKVEATNSIAIEYALCSKEDVFKKSIGKELCLERIRDIEEGVVKHIEIAPSIKRQFIKFVDRSKKYFRTNTLATKYIVKTEIK